MSTIRVKIKDEDRAYFFITKYDIPKDSFANVVVEDLPRDSADRFLSGILLDILEGDSRQDAIDKLSAYIYSTGSTGPGDAGVSGHVSITNVQASDGQVVGSRVFSQDDNRLEAAVSSTKSLTVSITAMTGPTNYKPVVSVSGRSVSLAENTNNRGVWTGVVDVELPLDGVLIATHEDGATDSASITFLVPPKITSAVFINGYPGAQTELKEDDAYSVLVTSDSPMSGIVVSNDGACKSETFVFPETTSKVITVRIADRGNVSALLPVILRASNSSGALGDLYDSSSRGSDDGLNLIRCNNLHPSVNLGSIDYPVGQEALKGMEFADVALEHLNTDQVLFSSPNDQLLISNTTLIEPIKEVQRIAGDYNVSDSNLKVVGVKLSNMAKTSDEMVVSIVNSPTVLSVQALPRLRSGGNNGTVAQNHTVVLNSTQQLRDVPTMIAQPGRGIFVGSWVGSSYSYVRQLRVTDTDPKGLFYFMGVGATGLSGLNTTTLSSGDQYEIGGFVNRRLYLPVLANEVNLGTNVVDVNKLAARDKDLIGMTYQSSLDDGIRRYSIIGTSDDTFYWADQAEVNNNTTGNSFIEIEELA
jgi:hypothetical protein